MKLVFSVFVALLYVGLVDAQTIDQPQESERPNHHEGGGDILQELQKISMRLDEIESRVDTLEGDSESNPEPTPRPKVQSASGDRITPEDFELVGGYRLKQQFCAGGLAIDFKRGDIYTAGHKQRRNEIIRYKLPDKMGKGDDMSTWPVVKQAEVISGKWGGNATGLAVRDDKLWVSPRRQYDTSYDELTIFSIDLETGERQEHKLPVKRAAFGGGFWEGYQELLPGCGGYESGAASVSGPSIIRMDGTRLMNPPRHGTMDWQAREKRPPNYSVKEDHWVALRPRDSDGDGELEGRWASDRLWDGGIWHPRGLFTVVRLGTGELHYRKQGLSFEDTSETWLYTYDPQTFDRQSVQFFKWPYGVMYGYASGPDGLIYMSKRNGWKGGIYKVDPAVYIFRIRGSE